MEIYTKGVDADKARLLAWVANNCCVKGRRNVNLLYRPVNRNGKDKARGEYINLNELHLAKKNFRYTKALPTTFFTETRMPRKQRVCVNGLWKGYFMWGMPRKEQCEQGAVCKWMFLISECSLRQPSNDIRIKWIVSLYCSRSRISAIVSRTSLFTGS